MKVRQRRPRDAGSVIIRTRKDGSKSFMLKWRTTTETVAVTSKKDAMDLLPAFVARAKAGQIEAERAAAKKRDEQPTLAEWSKTFLAEHVTQDADRLATRVAYESALRLYVLPTLGDKRLHEITAPMIRQTMQAHHADGRALGTIKLARAALRLALQAAIDDGLLQVNPVPTFAKLRLGEIEDPADVAQDAALNASDVAKLMAAPLPVELKLYAAILVSCGLRRGEAVGLQWRDLDPRNGALHVRRAAKKVREKGREKRIWLGRPKTKRSVRTIAIGPTLVAMLGAEKARQEAIQATLLGRDPSVRELRSLLPAEACIFRAAPETPTVPADPDNLARRFVKAAAKIGLVTWSHALRHTSISHAIEGGLSLADAAERAGHADVRTTASVYVHSVSESQRKAALIGDSLLAGPAEPERAQNDAERHGGS